MFEILEKYSDLIGVIGVFLVLMAYFLLNTNKLSSRHIKYLLCNFIGSILILFSLFYTWNLSSVVIEIAWILISLLGLYRVLFVKNQRH